MTTAFLCLMFNSFTLNWKSASFLSWSQDFLQLCYNVVCLPGRDSYFGQDHEQFFHHSEQTILHSFFCILWKRKGWARMLRKVRSLFVGNDASVTDPINQTYVFLVTSFGVIISTTIEKAKHSMQRSIYCLIWYRKSNIDTNLVENMHCLPRETNAVMS